MNIPAALIWIVLSSLPLVAMIGAAQGREEILSNVDLSAVELRTDGANNPLGIGGGQPQLGWELRTNRRAVFQSAFQVNVALTKEDLAQGRDLVWDSGKVNSDNSTAVVYEGGKLRSRQAYYWRVRVWDQQGAASPWSEVAKWETGLLTRRDWVAKWISSPTKPTADEAQAPPLLRREFRLTEEIDIARAYVTSHGLYQLYLNGHRVGDKELTPGWTSYNKRLSYQVYDIGSLLRVGDNAVGAILADGWYRGTLGLPFNKNVYGHALALLAQIEVTYKSGRRVVVTSDERWMSATGPIRMSEIYAGETYDARLEQPGWNSAGFDSHSWVPVRKLAPQEGALITSAAPPIRKVEEIEPARIFKSPAGATVVDFGQNMVGWVRLRLKGPAGSIVTLRHAEVLDTVGNLYTDNLMNAKQEVRYILSGRGPQVFNPHFTFQGFRYVAIDGYSSEVAVDSITGIVLRSDLTPTSYFESSSPLLNRLQQNILWSQRGNFVGIPTDCPQRDERLGWTADVQVFAPTAAFNMDVAQFLSLWLQDLVADQYADGNVPAVIPNAFLHIKDSPSGVAGWGDAATEVPWALYLTYGDRRILQTQYPSMEKWVHYEMARAGEDYIWDDKHGFGDWADWFSMDKGTDLLGNTPRELIATAYLARSAEILRMVAELLGKSADARRYAEVSTKAKHAFTNRFVDADGQIGNGTQTGYVLALRFNLLPEHLRTRAAEWLAEDVRERGHLTTGFLGTPGLLFALSDSGYFEEAYMLLNRDTYPSWLYPITWGATTMWERWNGIKPNGSFAEPDANSFNHYAYGAVGMWMYQVMGGIRIDPKSPGYKHVLIDPRPGGALTYVDVHHKSRFGWLRSNWRWEGKRLHLNVEIPPNTTGTVSFVTGDPQEITERGVPLAASDGIREIRSVGKMTYVEIGSGVYSFSYGMSSSEELTKRPVRAPAP